MFRDILTQLTDEELVELKDMLDEADHCNYLPRIQLARKLRLAESDFTCNRLQFKDGKNGHLETVQESIHPASVYWDSPSIEEVFNVIDNNPLTQFFLDVHALKRRGWGLYEAFVLKFSKDLGKDAETGTKGEQENYWHVSSFCNSGFWCEKHVPVAISEYIPKQGTLGESLLKDDVAKLLTVLKAFFDEHTHRLYVREEGYNVERDPLDAK